MEALGFRLAQAIVKAPLPHPTSSPSSGIIAYSAIPSINMFGKFPFSFVGKHSMHIDEKKKANQS